MANLMVLFFGCLVVGFLARAVNAGRQSMGSAMNSCARRRRLVSSAVFW